MGKKDSTVTRVKPVFDRLYSVDQIGSSWLNRLLNLVVDNSRIPILEKCNLIIRRCGWGENEVRLSPPVALLSYLIRNPRPPNYGILSRDPKKAELRRQWIEGKDSIIAQGLRLLTNNPDNNDWHIFEGPTSPDVFIETDDLIIVIEGKRTEKETHHVNEVDEGPASNDPPP